MAWIRGFLIVITGGLPATALLWFALFPLTAAVSVFGEHPVSALVTMVWFALAAAGTLALWLASFLPTGSKLVAGLVAGLLAIGPFAFFLVRDWFQGDAGIGVVTSYLIAGPAIVAIILILEFFLKAANRRK